MVVVFQEYYLEELEKDNVSPLPKQITNEYNASDRLEKLRVVKSALHKQFDGSLLFALFFLLPPAFLSDKGTTYSLNLMFNVMFCIL